MGHILRETEKHGYPCKRSGSTEGLSFKGCYKLSQPLFALYLQLPPLFY